MNSLNLKKLFGAKIALLTWFCVIFQISIAISNFISTLSFFTIQSNLLVAISLSFSIFLPRTKLGTFFSDHAVKTAVALYIFIVALVYNVVLRGLVETTGWSFFLDNMLHVVIPVLYILYWVLDGLKVKLHWKNGLTWLLFPLVYLIYSLIRGAFINWYPYPFLAVNEHGYPKVFINIGLMTLLFFLTAMAFIFVNNKLLRKAEK